MVTEAFGKIMKSTVPIYLLVPGLKDYFYRGALSFLSKMTQEDYFEKKFSKVPDIKKMFLKDPFTNLIKTPIGDYVFQLYVYDKYPNLPEFLSEKDANIKNSENPEYYKSLEKYFTALNKIMRDSKSEASVYRMEALVEKFTYNNMSIQLVSVSKIRFLYKRQVSTVKDIGHALRQTMVVMPKILKKANKLRQRVRMNSFIGGGGGGGQGTIGEEPDNVNITPQGRRGSLQPKNIFGFSSQKSGIGADPSKFILYEF
jgi:hypothetical protein